MLTIFGYDSDIHRCVPCDNSKRFCKAKGHDFEFISVVTGKDENGPVFNKEVIAELLHRLGRETKTGLTMPQIFREDTGEHIGGFTELMKYKF